jgi:hypothetical protein
VPRLALEHCGVETLRALAERKLPATVQVPGQHPYALSLSNFAAMRSGFDEDCYPATRVSAALLPAGNGIELRLHGTLGPPSRGEAEPRRWASRLQLRYWRLRRDRSALPGADGNALSRLVPPNRMLDRLAVMWERRDQFKQRHPFIARLLGRLSVRLVHFPASDFEVLILLEHGLPDFACARRVPG